jgi:BirA family biotin operon repressor/biotin-[acetyl-CoA-carboxylase] ligase
MIHWHDRLPSTMDEAHRLAAEGAPHGTTVVARIQEAGRGRRGRTWSAPEGGLWLSVVCRPSDPAVVEATSVRAGLAVAAALREALPGLEPISLKWPNDLLVRGRKLAGILCEARWEGGQPLWVVVGVGINVRNAVPEELRDQAIALGEVHPDADPARLAPAIAAAVARAGLGGTN